MKTLFKNIGYLALTMLVLASCKKDEEMLKVSTGDSPVLAASASTLVLTKESAQDTVITFSWNEYDMAWSDPALSWDISNYTLEIARAGTDFSSAYELDYTGVLQGKFTGEAFNLLLLNRLELPAGVESEIQIRLQSGVSANTQSVYSNAVSIKVTPYLISSVPDYPSLFVVGSHQGWSPETAPAIRSAKDDGMYEGFVNFPEAKTEFKLTTERDWDEAYGDGGPGLLSTTGGNVVQEGVGYYLIKFNKESLAWSAVKTTWALIGSATPGDWNSDTPLTYDAEANVWKATVTLTGGEGKEYKFRANGAWDIELGAGSKEGVLSFGGGNLKLAESGTYEVTLDLSNGAYYMYNLTKK